MDATTAGIIVIALDPWPSEIATHSCSCVCDLPVSGSVCSYQCCSSAMSKTRKASRSALDSVGGSFLTLAKYPS